MLDRLAWNWGRNTKRGRSQRAHNQVLVAPSRIFPRPSVPARSMTIGDNDRLDRHDTKALTRLRARLRRALSQFLAEDPLRLWSSRFSGRARRQCRGNSDFRSCKQLIALESLTSIIQIPSNLLIFIDNVVKIAVDGPNQSYLFWLSDACNMHKFLGIRGVSQNQICNFAGDEPKGLLLS